MKNFLSILWHRDQERTARKSTDLRSSNKSIREVSVVKNGNGGKRTHQALTVRKSISKSI